MAWERRRGRRYFYRPVRRGGRVVKEYYGNGPAAEAAERLLAEARRARAAEAVAVREMGAKLGTLDRVMGELDVACRRLTEAAMRAAGYRRSNYQWRRGRERPAGERPR
jgi:hypothetical protein